MSRVLRVSAAALFMAAMPAHATTTIGSNWVKGAVIDVTSTSSGVMVRMEGEAVPTDCAAAPWPWLLIAKEETAMISTLLTYWASGKQTFTVYTHPWTSGFCSVNQVDPED